VRSREVIQARRERGQRSQKAPKGASPLERGGRQREPGTNRSRAEPASGTRRTRRQEPMARRGACRSSPGGRQRELRAIESVRKRRE
jgi:hypothetical protein